MLGGQRRHPRLLGGKGRRGELSGEFIGRRGGRRETSLRWKFARRTVSCVNEDDEKLQTSITEKEDQMAILIIGGVEIFLPSGEERLTQRLKRRQKDNQQRLSWRKMEQILMSVPTEGECPVELLTQWELELKALEDWLVNPEPEGGCQGIAMPEEIHQHKSQLGEVGIGTIEGLAGENLSGEVVVEKQFSDEEPTGVETTTEWKAKATKEEDVLGSQRDFPIDKDRVQQDSLQ
jgi:hypothetical protein